MIRLNYGQKMPVCRLDVLLDCCLTLTLFRLVSFEASRMSSPCVKCRQGQPQPGDSWCLGCAGWEVIERELASRWPLPGGLRVIAEDCVLNAARTIRALRAVGAGSSRALTAPGAGGSVAAAHPKPETSSSGQKIGLAAKALPSKPKEQSEEETVYTYETETEESESPAEKKGKKQREKTPEVKRREKSTDRKKVKEEKASEEKKEERWKERHREEKDKKKKKKRDRSEKKKTETREGEKPKKTKRGGRKHKRLDRLKEKPFSVIHRALPEHILKERPGISGPPDRRDKRSRVQNVIQKENGSNGSKPFQINRGEVVEFRTDSIPEFIGSDHWAAFVVTDVKAESDASVVLEGRFVGANDEEVSKQLSTLINRRHKSLHLCREAFCPYEESENLVHARKVRWFPLEEFDTSYVTPWGKMVLTDMKEEMKGGRRKEEGAGAKPGREAGRRRERTRVPKAKTEAGGRRTARGRAKEPDGGGLGGKLARMRAEVLGKTGRGAPRIDEVLEVLSSCEEENAAEAMEEAEMDPDWAAHETALGVGVVAEGATCEERTRGRSEAKEDEEERGAEEGDQSHLSTAGTSRAGERDRGWRKEEERKRKKEEEFRKKGKGIGQPAHRKEEEKGEGSPEDEAKRWRRRPAGHGRGRGWQRGERRGDEFFELGDAGSLTKEIGKETGGRSEDVGATCPVDSGPKSGGGIGRDRQPDGWGRPPTSTWWWGPTTTRIPEIWKRCTIWLWALTSSAMDSWANASPAGSWRSTLPWTRGHGEVRNTWSFIRWKQPRGPPPLCCWKPSVIQGWYRRGRAKIGEEMEEEALARAGGPTAKKEKARDSRKEEERETDKIGIKETTANLGEARVGGRTTRSSHQKRSRLQTGTRRQTSRRSARRRGRRERGWRMDWRLGRLSKTMWGVSLHTEAWLPALLAGRPCQVERRAEWKDVSGSEDVSSDGCWYCASASQKRGLSNPTWRVG